MKTRRTNWLDRRIALPAPYLCLCLSDEEYHQAMFELGAKPVNDWIKTRQASATAHYIEKASTNELAVIVCLRGHETHTPVEVAGLLVHEAVHIWQQYCDHIGEQHPGREQEAYGVQAIAQELMQEFARRMGAA